MNDVVVLYAIGFLINYLTLYRFNKFLAGIIFFVLSVSVYLQGIIGVDEPVGIILAIMSLGIILYSFFSKVG